jgi:5-methylcytosine-specific restriction enzyme A
MTRIATLKPRLGGLDKRVAWQPSSATPKRKAGRWLMERNQRIKERDGFRCAHCGRVSEAVDVDHIVPLAKGGRDEDGNLQLLCRGPGLCHDRKSAEDRRTT